MARRAPRVANVLVATDLSAGSLRAARRVPLLPLRDGARVTVLTVVPSRPSKIPRSSVARARESCAAVALEIERRSRDRGVVVSTAVTVATGEPFVEIIQASRALAADLVVVGRRSKPSRWPLGSTAERVVRHGSRPVLVADLAPDAPYARAVIALDLSDASRDVMALGALVLAPKTHVRAVHAYRVPFDRLLTASASPEALKAYRGEVRDAARTALSDLLRRADVSRGWKVSLRAADPRVAILREVVERHADIVVVGTHGRAGVSHFLMGSVAEWVLREAPCDVLVGRPERFTHAPP